jgi:hypothetical protein
MRSGGGNLMRITMPIAIAFVLVGTPATAGDPIAAVHPGASATKARDIHDFTLGMPIREAMKRFTPAYAQGNQIQGKLGDIDLTFEVCPSGAIYFMQSTQALGHFVVDKKFLDALKAKLSSKYGPAHGTPDNLSWALTEPVRYTTGEVRPFTSNWMSALVMDDSGDGVSLELKMLDFRICWTEREKANQAPRNAATQALKL